MDTNILVYASAGTGRDEQKRIRALDLIDTQDFAMSAQVLQEFYFTMVNKAKRPLSPDEALEWQVAIELSERFRISYWDAAILAAAMAQGARTVYSEDLNNGQIYDTVRVVNPFLARS